LARNKTDSADAEIIARFCQQQQSAQWQPLSESQLKLQSLTRFLQELIRQQQDNRNRLENASCQPVIKCLKQLDKQLGKHIANVQKQIRQHLGEDEQLQKQNELLQSIPGMGAATAATVLAELPPDLASARTAATYAGVTPRQKQSGSSLRGRDFPEQNRQCPVAQSPLLPRHQMEPAHPANGGTLIGPREKQDVRGRRGHEKTPAPHLRRAQTPKTLQPSLATSTHDYLK
jgi:hypothetical protein